MEDYINYWLRKTVESTPNDAELGRKVRNAYWKDGKKTQDKEETKKVNKPTKK